MSHGKQFTLYSHAAGPNGWKPAILMNILGLAYHTYYLDFMKNESKSPEYTQYNPNGRVPAIIDHSNNDFVVWESDAILLYLVEKYDTQHKVSVTTPEDKVALNQWLFFQASGQGPYYGQAYWFLNFHQEKVPSAIERYQNEIRRVLGVLESVLSKQEWLVGGKFTIADLSFITWNYFVPVLLGESFSFEKEFPHTWAWHSKMLAMEPVKAAYEVREKLAAASSA